jgi:hypothetical protein
VIEQTLVGDRIPRCSHMTFSGLKADTGYVFRTVVSLFQDGVSQRTPVSGVLLFVLLLECCDCSCDVYVCLCVSHRRLAVPGRHFSAHTSRHCQCSCDIY